MEDLLAYKNISKNIDAPQGLPNIPEKSENRKATDVGSLVVFGGLMVAVIVIFSYTSSDGVDLDIFYDDDSWDGQVPGNRQSHIPYVILLCLIPIMLSIITITLYRFATFVTVWGALILGLLFFAALSAVFWFLSANAENEEDETSFRIFGIVFIVLLLFYIFVIAMLFRKVKLVIKLYKEAARCFFEMPMMMMVPIMCTLFQIIITAMFCFTIISLASTEASSYIIIPVAFTFLWEIQVILGVQYMIVAGAVAHWYFDKGHPHKIMTSLWNTIRFHLGTICFGGFMIALVDFARLMVKSLLGSRHFGLRICLNACLEPFEAALKFISNEALIETAIHAEPFFSSGKRAANMLLNNLGKTVGINAVGSFVQFICVVLIFGVTLVSSYFVFKDDVSLPGWLMVVSIVSLVIISCFFSLFKTMVETLFVCYCEDVTLNNGQNKPYHMSQDFEKFVQDARVFYNLPVGNQTPVVA